MALSLCGFLPWYVELQTRHDSYLELHAQTSISPREKHKSGQASQLSFIHCIFAVPIETSVQISSESVFPMHRPLCELSTHGSWSSRIRVGDFSLRPRELGQSRVELGRVAKLPLRLIGGTGSSDLAQLQQLQADADWLSADLESCIENLERIASDGVAGISFMDTCPADSASLDATSSHHSHSALQSGTVCQACPSKRGEWEQQDANFQDLGTWIRRMETAVPSDERGHAAVSLPGASHPSSGAASPPDAIMPDDAFPLMQRLNADELRTAAAGPDGSLPACRAERAPLLQAGEGAMPVETPDESRGGDSPRGGGGLESRPEPSELGAPVEPRMRRAGGPELTGPDGRAGAASPVDATSGGSALEYGPREPLAMAEPGAPGAEDSAQPTLVDREREEAARLRPGSPPLDAADGPVAPRAAPSRRWVCVADSEGEEGEEGGAGEVEVTLRQPDGEAECPITLGPMAASELDFLPGVQFFDDEPRLREVWGPAMGPCDGAR
jgi:hypothetical protein